VRVVLQLEKGSLGTFTGCDGEYSKDYSGNHIAVFECQLRSPPVLSLVDHTYIEFLMMHRLNFKDWKLVDLDNFMKGNPFYSEFVDSSTW